MASTTETAVSTVPREAVSSSRMRYLRCSPQKARLVVDLVRGKSVNDAIAILHFSRKAVARPIEKLLWSAVANAKEREGLKDERGLFVARVTVDGGPSLKRIRANSMGRAFRIIHRTSHITFVLGQRNEKKNGSAGRSSTNARKSARTSPAKTMVAS